MNYRHAYHAGNFADVLKHTALVALIQYLRKKEKPFAVIDTHAGGGLYDLKGAEAGKTGEAKAGIGRLHSSAGDPPALATYLSIVRAAAAGRYPGSPLIAAALLRRQDRLVAIEKHPEEFSELKKALAGIPNANALEADGYVRLKGLLPPPERRGLILIDPPYEREDEFSQAAQALIGAHRCFATGIFMLWYPMKTGGEIEAATGEILNAGVTKLIRIILGIGQPPDDEDRLSATGLLVVNPPYEFDMQMRSILARIAPALKQGEGATSRLEWLAGEGR